MKLAVKDREGNVYTNDMTNPKTIIEIHFGTSYTQVIVQDEIDGYNGDKRYMHKDVIIPTSSGFIAIDEDEIGEWAVV